MTGYYILKGDRVIPEPDVITWGKWFETANRQIELTETKSLRISTVFLGLDHSFGDGDTPILFETMVFEHSRPAHELACQRYATIDEARKGHELIVKKWVKK